MRAHSERVQAASRVKGPPLGGADRLQQVRASRSRPRPLSRRSPASDHSDDDIDSPSRGLRVRGLMSIVHDGLGESVVETRHAHVAARLRKYEPSTSL
jgi:hypothetical protein